MLANQSFKMSGQQSSQHVDANTPSFQQQTSNPVADIETESQVSDQFQAYFNQTFSRGHNFRIKKFHSDKYTMGMDLQLDNMVEEITEDEKYNDSIPSASDLSQRLQQEPAQNPVANHLSFSKPFARFPRQQSIFSHQPLDEIEEKAAEAQPEESPHHHDRNQPFSIYSSQMPLQGGRKPFPRMQSDMFPQSIHQ